MYICMQANIYVYIHICICIHVHLNLPMKIPSRVILTNGVASSLSESAPDDSDCIFESSGMVNTPSQLGALTVPDLLLGTSDALRITSADLATGGGVSEAALGRMNMRAPATGCLSPSSSLMDEPRLRSISVSLEVLWREIPSLEGEVGRLLVGGALNCCVWKTSVSCGNSGILVTL